MIKVIIVDDSAVVRQMLARELSKAKDINVIATAADPFVARGKILKYQPDVMTLDIEMPKMDGLTFLRKIMHYYPIPTIIISSLTQKGSAKALEALDAGAIDVVSKPGESYTIGELSDILIDRIRAAASVKIKRKNSINQKNDLHNKGKLSFTRTTNTIVVIGASTGGTVALEVILKQMPKTSPGIVIVQHMPEKFTKYFAERLDNVCEIDVYECKNGDAVLPGTALIAPGNRHTVLRRSGAYYYVEVKDGPPVFHQRPSVEVLFNSAAKCAGANAVGVILTGMGTDGVQGLLSMLKAGAHTIAQDEATSVVWGMPSEAVKIGAAEYVAPIHDIARMIIKIINNDS